MEVFEAVRTVLAVREFKKTPVPDPVLDKILEAGRLTASAMNKQPWHFIVLKDESRLSQLAGYLRSGRYISTAPVAVAVVVEKGPLAISDGSRAIQDMILTAWEEGVGSNWVGFLGMLDEVKGFLQVPDDLELLAVIPFGYPARQVGRGNKQRKPGGEITHLEEFGRPY
ncbi:MAG TPA: nitroreductase family protein [Actinomycetota bacterium]|nr:nitroreductase family protein [Actinomycetota bacterium]